MTRSLLPELHKHLQWPSQKHVQDPSGPGPAVYQRLAHDKIQVPLARVLGNNQVRVSILSGDSHSEESDPPIALVCEFAQALTLEGLKKTRALAWNFCRTPLLITLEPHLVRAWSCYEKPDARSGNFPEEPIVSGGDGRSLNLTTLTDTLHWIHLASGQFLSRHADRFDRNQRADVMLLENLRYVRKRLTEDTDTQKGLSEGVAHDLLARVIFVQFLIDRKDSKGRAALNDEKLAALHNERILAKRHSDLPSILRHKKDTFSLFKWLNKRFNGDLFPHNYSAEKREVKGFHLSMLADFVSGSLRMENGQYLLWPHYSFDTIPLEFISSIYEEFVTKRKDEKKGVGEHYTRPYLVDFMLDRVLPWGGTEYDVKILDPCCGSAVFLVKSFQRLVQRWRNAHPDQSPDAAFLRNLLENNLFGVDNNENAVRVASFSLYLAMCDEIDPRHYWTQVRFPPLRAERIRPADFFSEDVPGIRTREDAGRYDLVIGNAPWGKDSLTEKAETWSNDNDPWRIADEQIGPLFLAKAARLCKTDGHICMIQPAGALLFNISGPAKEFRKNLFTRYKVDEIFNLSALRFLKIFPDAVSPACIVNMRPTQPDGEAIAYWSPKRSNNHEGLVRVVIDEQDLNWVWPEEAADDPVVWPALMWGGRRDLETIRSISSRNTSLEERIKGEECSSARGFQRGTTEAKERREYLNIPILESATEDIWSDPALVTNSGKFRPNQDSMFAYPKPLSTYQLPVVILRNTWTVSGRRFEAKAVLPGIKGTHDKLLYSQSFFGIRDKSESRLAALLVVSSSIFAVYYLYLSSGRLASYRPTIRKEDFEQIPLPMSTSIDFSMIQDLTGDAIDEMAFSLFHLNEVERALVQDFVDVTLGAFKPSTDMYSPCESDRKKNIEGRINASRSNGADSRMKIYADWFLRVLGSGLGSDKRVCATIFRSPDPAASPFCMVGIHLDWRRTERIRYEDVRDDNLLGALERCVQDDQSESLATRTESIYYRRVSRIIQTLLVKEGRKTLKVPTVFIIKPNQLRYWTRSVALRDADNVVADLVKHGNPDQSAMEASIG